MVREWSEEDRAIVRTLYKSGGAAAVHRAFPDRSKGSVLNACRRYQDLGQPQPIASPEEARARLTALPLDLIADGLAVLCGRRSDYTGATP
jgi:hypothetical protein